MEGRPTIESSRLTPIQHRQHTKVVGESLLWPRVPMGEDTKRATKRKFKALVRVRSGVNNVGPMTFTAVVYRVEGNGVVTDLHQASATVTVTPGKSLLGGF